ncbi:beta-microseminoprotein-like isoform X1 [Dermochelys coriacea]|uniref:beta-microseminoprotein-like isoform X1 n=1 Tax=Dermochelys coriacea TaxID=27794 RepID=UPI0018E700F2|nr:beta-microseminoprotein-like isoform X1 [Dermochelys coriacea]
MQCIISLQKTFHRLGATNFTTKCFLGILLAFDILVTLCDAFCFFEQNDPLNYTKGCIRDGKLHGFGTSWTANCNRCYCSPNGIRCCSIYHSPSGYDREKCESIFNMDTCSYSVVEKADPSKACEVHSWVG